MNFVPPIRKCDIANGPGCRVSLFVSGCRNKCKGCFNPEAQDFSYGIEFTEHDLAELIDLMDHDYVEGLSILGGEPMEEENQPTVAKIIHKTRTKFGQSKNIWVYTGYVLEKDLDPQRRKWIPGVTDGIIKNIDVLVDGPFVEDLKDITLKFRGSSNQRIIHLKDGVPERIE